MNHAAAKSLFDLRQIAYALTNCDLVIQEIGGKTELFDTKLDDLIGAHLPSVIPELSGNEDALKNLLVKKASSFQLPLMHKGDTDTPPRYFNHLAIPQTNDQREIIGLIYYIEDVTEFGISEQRLTQQRNELMLLRDQMAKQHLELQAANRELQKLDEVKSQFVSVAAHELRTPLASIMGYVELLLEIYASTFDDKQSHYLKVIERSAGRLLTITNNLLDITYIETGRVELLLQPVNLQLLMHDVIDELRPLLDAKQQQISLSVEDEIPNALCDDERVMQIVANLLSNANKYTGEGGAIAITLQRAQTEGFIQIAVSDSGTGISESDQKRLFERFYRTEDARLSNASGTGLGLSIVQSLVELHGGEIWSQSRLGRGSTFYVTLPIDDGPPPG